MPTIDEMDKEIRKNMRDARHDAIGRDKDILNMRARGFSDLFKYLDRRSLPKKDEVKHILGRSKRWITVVGRVPKVEKKR
jgi:hypothetical protein